MTHLFTGIGAAVTTPFSEGDVDYKNFRKHLAFLKENHIQSFIVNGTTGEGSTLTSEEKTELLKVSLEVSDGQVPVIAGTGSNNTKMSIQASQEAEELGVDGLLVITPYYNKTSQRGLLAHFTAIADAVNIPVILYDVPARTGMTIEPETLRVLAEHPNIVGLKDATGDLTHLSRLQSVVNNSFAFYSGNDDLALPFLSQGGHGLISVAANVLPKEYQEMFESVKTNLDKANLLYKDLFPLLEVLSIDVNPIPVKVLTSFLGFGDYEVRLPLVTLEEVDQIAIIETYRHLIERRN
ncbi:4-hydroxy-tetrahydrodipicolinate synthase [Marinilactibacillus psychrotolerans]|uniref:4-hydroxy-tetrahydrodipicolinate synthase n=1 Tax=Marinilactibacillus psychrotolerans TaxID=191770 RepID=A0A5R9C6H8_9LACT|nr:4-hydroxy-tetrahydrodipicolinate synthase [Marinilactibacillus psychrotolerans]TLQ08714.1 4-hydroxy-tetrahydrodipicolinate synthase [Marinilactibacillus psychrotolerans]